MHLVFEQQAAGGRARRRRRRRVVVMRRLVQVRVAVTRAGGCGVALVVEEDVVGGR